MGERIERKSLTVELADQIESSIREGKWTGKLPGNRALAQRYGVNRKTCVAAMEILEQRQLVEPAEVGKCRTIKQFKEKNSNPSSKRGCLLILKPALIPLNLEDDTLLRSFQAEWETSGTVMWERVDFSRYRKPGAVLEKLIERHDASALVLYCPHGEWGEVSCKRIPSFQVGGTHGHSERFSLCSFAIDHGLEKVVRLLTRLGHRQILVPIDINSRGFRDAVVAGLARGLGISIKEIETLDLCPVFAEPNPEVWRSYWQKSFARARPTAVIVTEDVHLLSLYGFCYQQGIRIPRELSVISLNYEPHFDWCQPRPTMLRFPNRKALAHFQDWVRGGLQPIGKHFLELEIHDGESVARASDSRAK